MLFTNTTFIFCFLPVILAVCCLCGFSRRLQIVLLCLAGLLVYAWGEPVYIVLLLGIILLDYLFGLILGRLTERGGRRSAAAGRVLALAYILHIVLLAAMKYSDSILELVRDVMADEGITFRSFVLPMGISFYTLRSLSYLADVRRGDAPCQKDPVKLALYISFFPQLFTGPIMQYAEFARQLEERRFRWRRWRDIFSGAWRFGIGLSKAVLLGSFLSGMTGNIFGLTVYGATEIPVPVLLAWLGAVANALEIYFIFSGFSDMAIGLSEIFGFRTGEEFRHPFMAASLREFMSGWFLSLSAWFRQYVYLPLGGASHENQDRVTRNRIIVALLTGMWYSSGWPCICWAVLLFVGLMLENLFRLEDRRERMGLRHVYVCAAVVLLMVLFRCDTMEQLSVYISYMFGVRGNGLWSAQVWMYLREYGLVLIAAILCLFPPEKFAAAMPKRLADRTAKLRPVLYGILLPLLVAACLIVLSRGSYTPFIYTRL